MGPKAPGKRKGSNENRERRIEAGMPPASARRRLASQQKSRPRYRKLPTAMKLNQVASASFCKAWLAKGDVDMSKPAVLIFGLLCLALAACQGTNQGGIEDECTPKAADAGLCSGGVQVDS